MRFELRKIGVPEDPQEAWQEPDPKRCVSPVKQPLTFVDVRKKGRSFFDGEAEELEGIQYLTAHMGTVNEGVAKFDLFEDPATVNVDQHVVVGHLFSIAPQEARIVDHALGDGD